MNMTPKRILVVKLDEIGDVILSAPSLRSLRHAYPDAQISLVVKPEVYELVEYCPYVDRILTLSRASHPHAAGKLAKLLGVLLFCIRHRLFGYDLSILLRTQPYAIECLLIWISHARRRIGWLRPKAKWSRLCFSDVLPSKVGLHEVERTLSVMDRLGGATNDTALEIWFDNGSDGSEVENLIVNGRAHVAVSCAPPRLMRRAWPVERYAELIDRLHAQHPRLSFLATGGPSDIAAVQRLARLTGDYVIPVAGALSIRQTCALLEKCDVFVGNDSGPMHMAAAVGLPVVEISCHPENGDPNHANAPERFGPCGVPFRVCRPKASLAPCKEACDEDHAHCILQVSVDQVMHGVMGLLADRMARTIQ